MKNKARLWSKEKMDDRFADEDEKVHWGEGNIENMSEIIVNFNH